MLTVAFLRSTTYRPGFMWWWHQSLASIASRLGSIIKWKCQTQRLDLISICTYIYIYMCICDNIHIYIYITDIDASILWICRGHISTTSVPHTLAGASFVRKLLGAIGRANNDVLLAVCRLYFAPRLGCDFPVFANGLKKSTTRWSDYDWCVCSNVHQFTLHPPWKLASTKLLK